MFLALTLTLSFSSPFTEENAVILRIQSHTEQQDYRCLVLKQESQKNLPNCPKSYTNDIKVSPTHKGTEMCIMLIRNTSHGI